MNAQSVIALLIVLAALAYVTRSLWQKLRPARGDADGGACASGCGCTPSSAPAQRQASHAASGPAPRARP